MTADDWFVPGGAAIADGVGKLRLRPPKHWQREILEVWMTPPSINGNEIRSHWRSFQRHKKAWQAEIGVVLMTHLSIGRGYQRAIAGAVVRFPKRAARRDSGNFAAIPEKALGDALVDRQVIADDDSEHFYFGGVEFALEVGDPRTWIHLFLQPNNPTEEH